MRHTIIKLLTGFLAFLSISLLVMMFAQRNGLTAGIKKLEEGQIYRILEEEQVPNGKIRSIAESAGFLYVFYDYAGLVNVYTIDGAFQYGIQVGALSSGIGAVAVLENQLYIISTENVIYCFDGRALTSALFWDSAAWRNGETNYKDLEEQIRGMEQTITGSGFTIASGRRNLEYVGSDGTHHAASFISAKSSPLLLPCAISLLAVACILAVLKWKS